MSAILFERRIVGAFAKLTAVDPETGLEVSVMGPAAAPEEALRRLAAAKLRRALANAARTPSANAGAPRLRKGVTV